MSKDLRAALRAKLAGSTGQHPVALEEMYVLGSKADVKRALLELYHAHQAQTCLITRGGVQHSVWWESGNVYFKNSYGRKAAV